MVDSTTTPSTQYYRDLVILKSKPSTLKCFRHNSVKLRASFLLQFINYCGFVGKILPSRQKQYIPTKHHLPERTASNHKTRKWLFNAVKSLISLSKLYALRWKMGILSTGKVDGEFNYCHLLVRIQLAFTATTVGET